MVLRLSQKTCIQQLVGCYVGSVTLLIFCDPMTLIYLSLRALSSAALFLVLHCQLGLALRRAS